MTTLDRLASVRAHHWPNDYMDDEITDELIAVARAASRHENPGECARAHYSIDADIPCAVKGWNLCAACERRSALTALDAAIVKALGEGT